jgi:hypothetical protein
MAVAYKAISAFANSTTGNFSFSQPTGAAQGDLLVAVVANKGDTWTWPTGWTQVLSVNGTASNGGLRVAYIVRGASAPALTVSARANADVVGYCVISFTGFDTANPITLLQNATNTSPVNTTGTTALPTPDDMVMLCFGGSDQATFGTYTESTAQITPWTERIDSGTTNGSNTQVAIATAPVPAGTVDPYGPFQATGGGAGSSTIGVFLINQGATNPTGSLTVTETGSDTFSSSGTVLVQGSLTVTESGADTFDATGTAGSVVTGDLTVTETGSDTFASTGTVATLGSLTVTETGSDTFAGSGVVLVAGSLTATETGSDSFASTGAVRVSGSLTVTESGSDTFASTGSVVVTGSLSVTESGSDTFAGTGVASGTTTNRSATYTATGTVTLTRGLVSTRSFGYTATGASSVSSLKVLIQNFVYTATGTLTRTRLISRAFAIAATGTEVVGKQISKLISITGLGTLTYADAVSFLKEFSRTATGTLTFVSTFIAGGGGTVTTLLRRGKLIMNKFGRW